MTEVNVVYSIARSFDIYRRRVGHLRIYSQEYVHFSAFGKIPQYVHVDLIQSVLTNIAGR